MRSVFPAHFRPSPQELTSLWKQSVFAVDANVLLNFYRYSPETRLELESALKTVQAQLFVPHQAAREFLRNRLGVTAAQAEEYTKAIATIGELSNTLSNKKRHPFLPDAELPAFKLQADKLVKILDIQREALLDRLARDEILDFMQSAFEGRTGLPYDETTLKSIASEGEKRFAEKVPPGYEDTKKDSAGDLYRKYGDLIVWKQLIDKATAEQKPLIFVTDDKKEDWWLKQSGRTIGPRTELREEFFLAASKDFWMYTVDMFIAEAARISNKSVSEKVLEEIKEVREEVQAERLLDNTRYSPFRSISRDEMLKRLTDSERWANTNAEGFVGVTALVKNHLGGAGYDYSSCFSAIRQLEEEGLVEMYDHHGEGHLRPVRAIRLLRTPEYTNRPLEALGEMVKSAAGAG